MWRGCHFASLWTLTSDSKVQDSQRTGLTSSSEEAYLCAPRSYCRAARCESRRTPAVCESSSGHSHLGTRTALEAGTPRVVSAVLTGTPHPGRFTSSAMATAERADQRGGERGGTVPDGCPWRSAPKSQLGAPIPASSAARGPPGAGAGGAGAGANSSTVGPSTAHGYDVEAMAAGGCPMAAVLQVKSSAQPSNCVCAHTPAGARSSAHPPLPADTMAAVHSEVEHAFATIMQMLGGEARHAIPAVGSLDGVFVEPKCAGEGRYTTLRVIVMRPDVVRCLLNGAPSATCPCVCFVGEPRDGMMDSIEHQDSRIVVGLGRHGRLEDQPVAAYLSIRHTSGQWYNMVLYHFEGGASTTTTTASRPVCPVRAGVDGWMDHSRHGSILPFAVRHFRWVYKPVGVINAHGTFTVHGKPKSAVYDGSVVRRSEV